MNGHKASILNPIVSIPSSLSQKNKPARVPIEELELMPENELKSLSNILMIDKHNALCSTDNKQVRIAMKRHGVELHVTPFRHRWFWDTGIHCLTQDLDRD